MYCTYVYDMVYHAITDITYSTFIIVYHIGYYVMKKKSRSMWWMWMMMWMISFFLLYTRSKYIHHTVVGKSTVG